AVVRPLPGGRHADAGGRRSRRRHRGHGTGLPADGRSGGPAVLVDAAGLAAGLVRLGAAPADPDPAAAGGAAVAGGGPKRTRRYRPRPLLFVVWANAHGAVAMGGLALTAVTVAALLRARAGDARDRRRARALLVWLPVCGAATLLTPLGFGLWRFIRESMRRSH